MRGIRSLGSLPVSPVVSSLDLTCVTHRTVTLLVVVLDLLEM